MTPAESLARRLHAADLYGDRPYADHLADVARRLEEAGADVDTIAAGWLHDAVEHGHCTLTDILVQFGIQVAHAIRDVTDTVGTRGARFAALLLRLPSMSRPGLHVKLADRASNMAGGRKMYLAEWRALRPVIVPLVAGDPVGLLLLAQCDAAAEAMETRHG